MKRDRGRRRRCHSLKAESGKSECCGEIEGPGRGLGEPHGVSLNSC